MMAVTLFRVAFLSGSLTSITKLLSGSSVKFMGTLHGVHDVEHMDALCNLF